jgi:hypothetical protein
MGHHHPTARRHDPMPTSPLPSPVLRPGTGAGASARPSAGAASLALVLALVLGLAACGEAGEVDGATRERVVALGDSAAMSLVRTLGGKLNGQLASNGPAGAIQFCAGEAQALTDSVSAALGPEWEVKRTTQQTRNPRNAPDSLEAVALQRFRAAEEAGEEMASHVQRTETGDYRYYMPLRMGHMCLECHGPREGLEREVRDLLDSRYPADQAAGYAEGDFRGVVRVTIPAEAVH